MRRTVLAALAVAALLAAAPGALAAPVTPGVWRRSVPLPATGSAADLYVPDRLAAAVAGGEAVPAIVFLHGAGGLPAYYLPFLAPAAESAGAVVIVPHSLAPVGWGASADPAVIAESLTVAGRDVRLDAERTAVAGHSAGGAYAYLLAYGTASPFSAVFTLAAPFYPVSALADPAYVPPIRMFYGTADPNYSGGAHDLLVAQWRRLGVSWEDDVRAGYGHSALPAGALADGFAFLVGRRRAGPGGGCTPSPTALCLEDGRFRVEVAWDDFSGGHGAGRVVPVASDDAGLFWFFSPDNWELLVKVLDGCALNDRFWVFSAATTDVGYTLTVTDTATDRTWSSSNPPGRAAPAVTDTVAFDTCGG